MVGGVGLLVVAVWLIGFVLLLVFAGVLLAILLTTMAELMSRMGKMGPRAALTLTIALLTGTLALGAWKILPDVIDQVVVLIDDVPRASREVRDQLERHWLGQWVAPSVPAGADAELVPWQRSDFLARLGDFFGSAFWLSVSTAVVVVFGLHFAYQSRTYIRGLLRLVPKTKRRRARRVLRALAVNLRWWLLARVIGMVIVTIATGLGLHLLGMPLALALGLLAGFLNFIPNVGPIVAAIPSLLLALALGPEKFFQVLALYTVIQTWDGYIFTPLIHRRTIAMPPVMLLFAQAAMTYTAGALGLFLASPLAAVVLVLASMLYVEDLLDDHVPTGIRTR
jgi:predicted PurR-regulated permease PerM